VLGDLLQATSKTTPGTNQATVVDFVGFVSARLGLTEVSHLLIKASELGKRVVSSDFGPEIEVQLKAVHSTAKCDTGPCFSIRGTRERRT
jgi:hypothetical protein